MIEDKTKSTERQIPLPIMFLSIIVLAIIFFLTGYYHLIPIEIIDLFLIVVGIIFVLANYFRRGALPGFFENLISISCGLYVGFSLNFFLSTRFLSNPSFLSLTTLLFITSILLWANFKRHSNIGWRSKLAFIFMGCWIISLIFGASKFIGILTPWLSLYPSEEVPGIVLMIPVSVTVDIIKSLFLSSLFNVLERITRISNEMN